MRAWEDVCEDLGFSDMHAQISPKNQHQCCLSKQDKGIKKPSQIIHWFSKKSVFLSHMVTFYCSIVQLKVMSTSHATFDGIKTCLVVGYSSRLVSKANQNPTRNQVKRQLQMSSLICHIHVPKVLALGFPCPTCLYKCKQ